MLSTISFWSIWLFIFIPVVAWVLGFVLPVKSEDSKTTKPDGGTTGSTPTQTTGTTTTETPSVAQS